MKTGAVHWLGRWFLPAWTAMLVGLLSFAFRVPGQADPAAVRGLPAHSGGSPGSDGTMALVEVFPLDTLSFVAYVVLVLVVTRWVGLVVKGRLQRWVERSGGGVDDRVPGLAAGLVQAMVLVLFLKAGLNLVPWPFGVLDLLHRGLKVVVGVAATLVALRLVDILLDYWKRKAAAGDDPSFDALLFPIIGKTLKVFVSVTAVLVLLQNLDVNITSLLAGLSVGGLALGLAAQDTVANIFGAVSVLVDKPFRIGDRIRLAEVEGFVESIGLRSTRVRNLDGYLVTIPNKTMGNSTITNISRRPTVKTEMNLGLSHELPVEKVERALAILREVYRANPLTEDLMVGFNRFTDAAVNVQVIHWWRGDDLKQHLGEMERMNLAVKARFDAEGIRFWVPPAPTPQGGGGGRGS